MTYTNLQIAQILNAEVVGCTDEIAVTQWLTDSRTLSNPQDTLFFALVSPRGDGHNYISELAQRGVRVFVVSSAPSDIPADISLIKVMDTLKALQQLARYHRQQFNIPVAAITGSNGKTIVKEWLASILAPSMRVTRSPRSFNSQVGVPLSITYLNENTEVGIFEAGISKPGEMNKLEQIIQPTVGIFTNLGTAHIDNFTLSSAAATAQSEIAAEKLQLMKNCETIIYPADNSLVRSHIDRHNTNANIISWTKNNQPAAVQLLRTETSEDEHTLLHYSITQAINNTTPTVPLDYIGEHRVLLPFCDSASIDNAMTVICAALAFGITPALIAERMPLLETVNMRLEVKEGKRGIVLINDSYNSDLSSLSIALDFLSRRSLKHGLPTTLILSDIPSTGETPEMLYNKASKLIQQHGIEQIVAIGNDIKHLDTPHVRYYTTTHEFLRSRQCEQLRDRIILLKGARQFQFEMIDEVLTLRRHETKLTVNLSALIGNLNHYRAMLRPATQVICMVKADAYGAGAIEVAKTLQEHRADYLAVAVADEGIALRRAGITTNIMVMNPEVNALAPLFEYRLEPEIYSFEILKAVADAAEKTAKQQVLPMQNGFPVHIKIDTGMHRMGFEPDSIQQLIETLQATPALQPVSVFSHLAGVDSEEFDAYTRQQIATFTKAANELQKSFTHHIKRHILNSAGAERLPEAQFDAIRLGIGLYGVNPLTNTLINNVSTLETVILQIRELAAGETVGYSRCTTLLRPSRIADIPIGYADGLRRALGNGKGYCVVNGKRAPFVGNICMDIAMIDVTDIPCREHDTVEIFGEQLPVTTIATQLDTIPYEVLTAVSQRVKRVYVQYS